MTQSKAAEAALGTFAICNRGAVWIKIDDDWWVRYKNMEWIGPQSRAGLKNHTIDHYLTRRDQSVWALY